MGRCKKILPAEGKNPSVLDSIGGFYDLSDDYHIEYDVCVFDDGIGAFVPVRELNDDAWLVASYACFEIYRVKIGAMQSLPAPSVYRTNNLELIDALRRYWGSAFVKDGSIVTGEGVEFWANVVELTGGL